MNETEENYRKVVQQLQRVRAAEDDADWIMTIFGLVVIIGVCITAILVGLQLLGLFNVSQLLGV